MPNASVIALHIGYDLEYSYIGPIEMTETTEAMLRMWSDSQLENHGGRIHWLRADVDATKELLEWVEEHLEYE